MGWDNTAHHNSLSCNVFITAVHMSVARDVSKGKENQEIWILIMPESNQTKSNDKNSGQKKKKKLLQKCFSKSDSQRKCV